MTDAYLVIAGEERKVIKAGQTVKDILAEMGIERGDGEILLVSNKEVTDTDIVQEGTSLIYVPPVDLGV
jgi:uncharacterized protein YabE (DUF348 family)